MGRVTIDDASRWSALLELARAQGFFVCVEDLEEESQPPLYTERISVDFRDTPIERIVEVILEESGDYHWRFDDDVLSLTRKALAPEDNPFELAVEGFQFTGTPDDFLLRVLDLAPGYMTSRLRIYRVREDEPEVQFEVQPGSLREAFNAFARASGMGWYAEVVTEPKNIIMEGPSHAPQDLGSFRSINFSLIHMQHDR